jgi:hypothetical protein
MLESYYFDSELTSEKHKRFLAVQAALEIAKAAATNDDTVANALKGAGEQVNDLANAIQSALDGE